MNNVQIHLALTHVPVILSLVGLAMLAGAIIIKSSMLTKTSYIVILVAAIAAVPVYFTGEGTEHAVENLAGISGNAIEQHEELAKLAMISMVLAGVAALAALMMSGWQMISRVLRILVLLLCIISGGLMAGAAHYGGQIRHTEIGNGAVMQSNDAGNKHSDTDRREKEND